MGAHQLKDLHEQIRMCDRVRLSMEGYEKACHPYVEHGGRERTQEKCARGKVVYTAVSNMDAGDSQ